MSAPQGSPAAPVFADSAPKAETTGGTAGSVAEVPRADHAHPRLSSATIAELDLNGVAVVNFTRAFSVEPCAILTELATGASQPTVVEVTGWAKTGENWTGATIKGYRSQPLPVMTTVSGLLSAVITGVNTVVAALTGFNVFPTAPAGTRVSCVFLQPSG